jgi:hypothetical protein
VESVCLPYAVISSATLGSTYRPSELGFAEIKILSIFAHSKSQSVYGISKELKRLAEMSHRERSPAYKDVHKRVKRLVHLKLVEQIKEHFERGAKHYKITPYGLITYLDKVLTENHTCIITKKTLLYGHYYLNPWRKKLYSFHLLKDFPSEDIGEYLHDCYSITADICKQSWTKIERYTIVDILPNDEIIQKYMAYLDGKLVDQNVLNEIKGYQKRLTAKLNNNDGSVDKELADAIDKYEKKYFSSEHIRYFKAYKRVRPQIRNYVEERPPFPMLDIFHDIVWDLGVRLEDKTKLLAFHIVSVLGDLINSNKIKNQDELEELYEKGGDYSLRGVLKDKRFIELVRAVKEEFDTGYKQFLYYH